jgi:hypothetical protein
MRALELKKLLLKPTGGFNTRRDDEGTRALAARAAIAKSTTAERVTAEGRQDNARAQRLGSYTAPIVKPTTARFGVGGDKTVMHNGRSMANVTADQLKETGLALPQYMRLWGKTGARPAAGAEG